MNTIFLARHFCLEMTQLDRFNHSVYLACIVPPFYGNIFSLWNDLHKINAESICLGIVLGLEIIKLLRAFALI